MVVCDMDCFSCQYEDCINDRVYSEKSRYCNRSEVQKQHQRESSKRKYHEAKEKGLCVVCKKQKATHGLKCYECYIRQKRFDKDKYDGRRNQWREEVKCYFCGGPVAEGKKVCEKHYQTLLKNVERCNAHENTKNARQQAKKEMWR